MATLLITRPENDPPTRYLSKWSEKLIDEAGRHHHDVIDLHRDKAVRDRVVGTLKKRKPRLVVLNGHGSDQSVTGHDNEVILQVGDGAEVKSTVIFARSCASARGLGPDAVDRGAEAYIGYDDDFWLMYNDASLSKPSEDRTAALFLEPSNHVVVGLLKGHSAGEANERSKNLFRKNIQKLLVAGPSDEDYSAVRLLYWNMIHQVCVGNQSVTV